MSDSDEWGIWMKTEPSNAGSMARRHMVQLKLKYKLWSARNWLKGYQFRPVQRYRCCEHTTPFHAAGCDARRLPDHGGHRGAVRRERVGCPQVGRR